jgi:hypothetical protein
MRINPEEMLPRFYGYAWREYNRMEYIALPIPINIIYKHARNLWNLFKENGWRNDLPFKMKY